MRLRWFQEDMARMRVAYVRFVATIESDAWEWKSPTGSAGLATEG